MPVTVRSLKKNTIVTLSSRSKEIDSVSWNPAGDPGGDDIQQVPDSMVEQTSFLKAVGLGLLAIETDDYALRESIAKQAKRYTRTQVEAEDELAAMVDNNSQRGVIRISEAEMDAHIAKLSESQHSALSNIGEN